MPEYNHVYIYVLQIETWPYIYTVSWNYLKNMGY